MQIYRLAPLRVAAEPRLPLPFRLNDREPGRALISLVAGFSGLRGVIIPGACGGGADDLAAAASASDLRGRG
eukprot:scaffold8073_cov68-Phaeocystis_antarctica.AAC.2